MTKSDIKINNNIELNSLNSFLCEFKKSLKRHQIKLPCVLVHGEFNAHLKNEWLRDCQVGSAAGNLHTTHARVSQYETYYQEQYF